jgi:ATP adenylyltransferase
MTLDRLWAGWRSSYVADAVGEGGGGEDADDCVFCRILASDTDDDELLVLWRGATCIALMNAYPYNNGHLLVLPQRHVGELEELTAAEAGELWPAVTDAVRAVKGAYDPEGVNIGANLGKAAGAGVPGHAHVHCLPRWAGDTNFMTSVAEARVLPEPLADSWKKLRAAWPVAEERA